MVQSELKTTWRLADPVGLIALVSIVLAALTAYHNCFTVPFIFDDSGSIVENHTIRQLWPQHLTLPDEMRGATVDGRPFLNFTFAVNYALDELNPRGYHTFNLFIHVLAALTIFGLVRRLASRAPTGSPLRDAAPWLALTTALLWVVHPLQTQAVTYTVQRAESLASLFYLLVLYFLLRSNDSAKALYWQAAAFFACLLGVATKEIVATAPLAALLFDRTFLSKSYSELYERRKWFHASLWSTLGLLGWLMHSTGGRENTAGFGSGLSPLEYLQTQIWAIPHYLSLAFYPSPLVFIYSNKPVTGLANLLLPGIILFALLSATIRAIVGKYRIAFPAALFFLVLSPTSSFVPITDPVFEHRMYLPLACVVAISVLFAFGCWERVKPKIRGGLFKKILPPAAIALAITALTLTTIDRNCVYADPINIWKDAISKVPDNGRAYKHLGIEYNGQGRSAEAIAAFETALSLAPDDGRAYTLLGTEYNRQGRSAEAIAAFETALSLAPDDFMVLNNLALAYQLVGKGEKAQAVSKRLLALNPDISKFKVTHGMLLLENGKPEEALQLLMEAEEVRPGDAILINRIGYALLLQGKPSEALPYLERAISMRPDVLEMHFNFGQALMATGQPEKAARAFEEELRLSPQDFKAWMNLGASLVETGNDTGALNAFERAIELAPTDIAARLNASSTLIRMEKFAAALEHIGRAEAAAPLSAGIYGNKGTALLGLGKTEKALRSFVKAIEINPEDGEAHANMGITLLSLGRQRESLEYLRAAVKLLPGKPALHNYLGKALLETGQAAQASEEFTMALKLDPYFTEARQGLQSANAARTGNTRSTRQ